MAISLDRVSSFDVYSPDDLVFDPQSGNLFVVQNYRVSEQPQIITWKVSQFTPSGQLVSSFTSNELGNATGISLLPNGNLLLVSTRSTRVAEFTKKGELVGGGFDFTSNGIFVAGQRSIFSIFYKPETDTVLALDSRTRRYFDFNREGQIVNTTDFTSSFTAAGATGRFAGITRDPLTGNFIITDDETDAATGDNRLYEVTPSGQILANIDLVAATGGIVDPEGVTIDPATRTLYVAFDNDDERGNEFYLSNRNKVVTFKIEVDTFAGDTNTADNKTGDDSDNSFLGGGGNDIYNGGKGKDIIYGGLDNDTLNGNEDNDQVFGGAGDDLARGGSGDDYVGGSTGNDTLYGDRGNDSISGGAGNDLINGNEGDDNISGGEGDDSLHGGRANDFITGDQGNDILEGEFGVDTLNGGEGDDSLVGGSGEDFLYCSAGADTLVGGSSKDTFVLVSGTGGKNVITDFLVGEDLISLTGGLSFDQLNFNQAITNNITSSEILIAATGEVLATLTNVPTALLGRGSFTPI